MGSDQIKQIELVRVWAGPNIPKSDMGQTEPSRVNHGPDGAVQQKICPDNEFGRTTDNWIRESWSGDKLLQIELEVCLF